jgi:acetyl esterase/lipase
MASVHGWSVTAPLYPLAPENTADHITNWAMDYYTAYKAEMGDTAFVMGGDSAGGGLTAALAQMARDKGHALPASLLLICPWLNLDPSHPDQLKTEPRDGILTISGITEGGVLYAGDLPRTDPRCSPIFGNWDGLPPILAFAGGDDILVTDARALKAKLPSVEHIEMAGMLHDWPIFSFSESRKAQAKMANFVTPAVT